MVQVDAIKAFDDNYIWVIKDPLSSNCWVVDPGDEQPVLDYLAKFDLTLQGILVTHHHWDHTDGIAPLLSHFPSLTVYGPKNGKYKGITHGLCEHDKITLFDTTLNIIATPGHTLDHICYVNDELAFTGIPYSMQVVADFLRAHQAKCGAPLKSYSPYLTHVKCIARTSTRSRILLLLRPLSPLTKH